MCAKSPFPLQSVSIEFELSQPFQIQKSIGALAWPPYFVLPLLFLLLHFRWLHSNILPKCFPAWSGATLAQCAAGALTP
jgi:hypothetical protein